MEVYATILEANKLTKDKKFEEAEKLYQMLLQDTDISNRDLAVVKNNIGQLKYLHVLFDEAVIYYNEAVKLDPSLSVAYYNRGTIYYRMGDFTKAIGDFEKATLIESNSEEFQLAKSRCLEQLKSSSASKGIHS